jgi:hypothetical protein
MDNLANLSPWQWIIVLAYIASVTVPFYKIFPRAGIPAWIAVFGVVPMIPLIFLWLLAFMKWPQDNADDTTVIPPGNNSSTRSRTS